MSVFIYNYDNYREYLRDYISTLPKSGRGQLKKIADFLNVHSTFVSQVLNGLKDFSMEQCYQITKFLSLTDKESDYFLLMLQMNRAGTSELKKHFQSKLNVVKHKLTQVKEQVGTHKELTEHDRLQYYSDWRYALIWLSTFFEENKTIENIASFLKLPRKEVKVIIEFLLETGICLEEDQNILPSTKRIHIPTGSSSLKNHHLNWRLKSLEFINDAKEANLAFTAPICLSKKDFKKINSLALEYISNISKIVEESPPEIIACLNIDCFNLTTEDQ